MGRNQTPGSLSAASLRPTALAKAVEDDRAADRKSTNRTERNGLRYERAQVEKIGKQCCQREDNREDVQPNRRMHRSALLPIVKAQLQ